MKFKVNCKKKKEKTNKPFSGTKKKKPGDTRGFNFNFLFFLLIEQTKLNYREAVITEWLDIYMHL
jgi:hypothetical protein